MATIAFDVAAFRGQFPDFADTNVNILQAYWDIATNYASDQTPSCTSLAVQTQYLNLMTAHIAALQCQIAAGETPGLTQAATVDKVSVTLTPPPERNQFQWWLNLTAYGQQLLALLQVQSVGGFYIGGSCEQRGFRKAGGVF